MANTYFDIDLIIENEYDDMLRDRKAAEADRLKVTAMKLERAEAVKATIAQKLKNVTERKVDVKKVVMNVATLRIGCDKQITGKTKVVQGRNTRVKVDRPEVEVKEFDYTYEGSVAGRKSDTILKSEGVHYVHHKDRNNMSQRFRKEYTGQLLQVSLNGNVSSLKRVMEYISEHCRTTASKQGKAVNVGFNYKRAMDTLKKAFEQYAECVSLQLDGVVATLRLEWEYNVIPVK